MNPSMGRPFAKGPHRARTMLRPSPNLLWAALRWRLPGSLALLTAATFAVTSAAAGPIYLRTAYGTVLHAKLAEATSANTAVNVGDYTTSSTAATVTQQALPLRSRFHLGRWFGPSVFSIIAEANLSTRLPLVARSGVCRHLRFIAGSCPRAKGQIAITTRSARVLGVHLGSVLDPTGPPGLGPVKVVGLIAAGNPTAPYWLGQDYFGFGGGHLDSGFTVPSTLAALPSIAMVQLPLVGPRVTVDTVPEMEAAASSYEAAATQQLGLTANTGLFSALNTYFDSADLMTATVLVVDSELVLLALFVLYGLVARTAEARMREVALAKLHGFGSASVFAVGLLEPLVLVLGAMPLGVGLAMVLVGALQRVFLPQTQLTFTIVAVWAAIAALGGGVVAVVAGASGIVRRPLTEELNSVPSKTPTPAAAALDTGVVAAAVAGLLELLSAGVLNGQTTNPLAALAPGLIAAAMAVIGVRALPFAAAIAVHRTRNSSHLALFLAVRQVLRRPAILRQITVLTLGVSLCVFAVSGWASAGANRAIRAEFALGAARVLTVSVPSGVSLIAAVDRADPSGRYAMAAMVSKAPGGSLLAVQAARLPSIGYWAPGISRAKLTALVHWLRPRLPPPLTLSGSQARITITMTGSPSPPPDLVLNMLDNGGDPEVVDFGYLRDGTHTYTTTVPSVCSGGCRVVQIVPYWTSQQVFATGPGAASPPPQRAIYQLALSRLETAGPSRRFAPVAAQFANDGYWTGSGTGIAVHASGAGRSATLLLAITDSIDQPASPSVAPAVLPAVLPGIATSATSVQDPAAAPVLDFDGTGLTLNLRYRVRALPQLGGTGFLMNLTTAVRAETGPATDTQDQVWLSASAPPSMARSLTEQGLRVLSAAVPATAIRQMDAGGEALAFLFFIVAASATAVLSLAAVLLTLFMSSRRRTNELAVLRAVGLGDRTLLWTLLLEQLLVLLPGLLLGLFAGWAGAVLALPSVPVFSTTAGAPPVQVIIDPLPIAVALTGLLIAIGVTVAMTGTALLRRASWRRLRTTE